jgi:hypothetical protein
LREGVEHHQEKGRLRGAELGSLTLHARQLLLASKLTLACLTLLREFKLSEDLTSLLDRGSRLKLVFG